jgi:hypothetical protein
MLVVLFKGDNNVKFNSSYMDFIYSDTGCAVRCVVWGWRGLAKEVWLSPTTSCAWESTEVLRPTVQLLLLSLKWWRLPLSGPQLPWASQVSACSVIQASHRGSVLSGSPTVSVHLLSLGLLLYSPIQLEEGASLLLGIARLFSPVVSDEVPYLWALVEFSLLVPSAHAHDVNNLISLHPLVTGILQSFLGSLSWTRCKLPDLTLSLGHWHLAEFLRELELNMMNY